MTGPDPRIEAIMDSLAVTALYGNSPPRWRVEDALAAADAVDPLRAEDFLALVMLCEKIVDKHYPAGTFTGSSGDRGARFVAALRAALAQFEPATVAR